jgi:NAD(P)-dependent dehydrogenase (short-subunit alcohol dehydrogenase family)
MYSYIDELYEKIHDHKININNKNDYESMKRSIFKLKKIATIFENKTKNYETKEDIKEDTEEPQKYNKCYICNVPTTTTTSHDFYTKMCNLCGIINKIKRDSYINQKGKIALITGGRVKIGYETALRLLRCECQVIITTRFAKDALQRYINEPDHNKWIQNLKIFEADFLSLTDTKNLVNYLFTNYTNIDYLINNAAQTIDRPRDFYNHLLLANPDIKLIQQTIINHNCKLITNNNNCDKIILEQDTNLFPLKKYDQFGQQIDLRNSNSWILEIDQINITEFLKVQAVNNITPFVLINQLLPLLKKEKNNYSWIINVSSMEGIFNWKNKSSRHVHTNMAKSSINMMTRTCGDYLYHKYNIVMCAVETGWNNSQFPNSYEFKTPIDCLDGAMRILDPIFCKLTKYGIIYKDYQIYNW